MRYRKQLPAAKRWVVKIGSSLLTAEGQGLDYQAITQWVAQIVNLMVEDRQVLLVSSGSVAEGMSRLGWSKRPQVLHKLQAAAAVGQMGLIQAYESCFQKYDLHTAQVLLTHDDLSNRQRYLHARSTLCTLIHLGVVPVINENDTVTTEEICLGDNDTLAALVANLVQADVLVILTDQTGLYEKDPRRYPQAKLISDALVDEPRLVEMAAKGVGDLGRGGMRTKVKAARIAARSGSATVIVGGREPQVLQRVVAGEVLGTFLAPTQDPMIARKQWIAGQLQMTGCLTLDPGAIRGLCEFGGSLLAVGVQNVAGKFIRGEMVSCVNGQGTEVARGLINYSAGETRKIMGHSSQQIKTLLGYVNESELIHRDNLALV